MFRLVSLKQIINPVSFPFNFFKARLKMQKNGKNGIYSMTIYIWLKNIIFIEFLKDGTSTENLVACKSI
jgi:hypothetical protein